MSTPRARAPIRRLASKYCPENASPRFFEKLDGSYQVTKSLRDLIVFARHDLMRDPPFSRMDLISCRNVLIYIEPEPQRRALALFHFALREGGRLFLSEARRPSVARTICLRLSPRSGASIAASGRHGIISSIFRCLAVTRQNGIGSTHCRRTKLRYASPRQPGGCCLAL